MSALLRKEMRLLLPSFVIALLLTCSIPFLPHDPSGRWGILYALPFVFCPAMGVMMALDCFGREMSSGTFSNLLAQPLPRGRIWWTKSLLLLGALAIILIAWWFNCLVGHVVMTDQESRELLLGTGLFALAIYAGGLWTVLLFRQVAVAFWFTLIVPGAISMTIIGLLNEKHPDAVNPTLGTALIIYSVAGFLFGWRLFLRAQDVQWTGGTIELPGWLKLPGSLARTGARRGRHPRAALLAKEFQLHQSQLLIAGVLTLLHLGIIATRKLDGGFKDSPVLEFLLENFWLIWFAMPLLVGCAAVAEERKLGTSEAQLCLPVRRRTQFVFKFAVALALSVALGVGMPLLLEGHRILSYTYDFNISEGLAYLFTPNQEGIAVQTFFFVVLDVAALISAWLPFLMLAGMAALIGAISFYASTLVRNTLQALAPALLGIFATWFLLILAYQIENSVGYPLWRGWLIYLIGVPILTLTFAGLTYWNFKLVLVGWNVWRRNAIIFFAALALVMLTTSVLYHRAWEFLETLEPPHGVARLTPSQSVTIKSRGYGMSVSLPDGKIWLNHFVASVPNFGAILSGRWVIQGFGSSGFLEGTNWTSVAMCNRDVVGIQRNGSLWVSEQPENPNPMRRGQLQNLGPLKLVRFGDDNNWKTVDTSATLLKSDGSLWRLGATNRFNWKKPWPGLRAFEPQRLGTDSDWAEIFSNGYRTFYHKTNGQTWRFASSAGSVTNAIQVDDKIFLIPVSDFELIWSRGDVWASTRNRTFPNNCMVGVRQDGTFRITGAYQLATNNRSHLPPQWKLAEQNIQLGKETNWLAVAGDGEVVITLKADGSLWKWNFPDDPVLKLETAYATRLSKHSDWVAISQFMGDVVSLAADGSLWLWRFGPRHYHPSQEVDLQFLLATSRKPQKIANIFNEVR